MPWTTTYLLHAFKNSKSLRRNSVAGVCILNEPQSFGLELLNSPFYHCSSLRTSVRQEKGNSHFYLI